MVRASHARRREPQNHPGFPARPESVSELLSEAFCLRRDLLVLWREHGRQTDAGVASAFGVPRLSPSRVLTGPNAAKLR